LPLIFPLLETNKCCKHCGSNSASNLCSINSAASRSSRKWCKIPGLVPAISCFWTLATSPSVGYHVWDCWMWWIVMFKIF
jgi:hypothetical protein